MEVGFSYGCRTAIVAAVIMRLHAETSSAVEITLPDGRRGKRGAASLASNSAWKSRQNAHIDSQAE